MNESMTPKPQLFPRTSKACRLCGATYNVKVCPVFISDDQVGENKIKGWITILLCGWCENKVRHGGWIDGIRPSRRRRKKSR